MAYLVVSRPVRLSCVGLLDKQKFSEQFSAQMKQPSFYCLFIACPCHYPGICYTINVLKMQAEVAELVDAHDSKSCGETHEGSIPSFGTWIKKQALCLFFYPSMERNRTGKGRKTIVFRGGGIGTEGFQSADRRSSSEIPFRTGKGVGKPAVA